jgi:hypothetical protein
MSKRHRSDFVESVHRVSRLLSQSLQDFRNRLSERALEALGVPLRTWTVLNPSGLRDSAQRGEGTSGPGSKSWATLAA